MLSWSMTFPTFLFVPDLSKKLLYKMSSFHLEHTTSNNYYIFKGFPRRMGRGVPISMAIQSHIFSLRNLILKNHIDLGWIQGVIKWLNQA